MRVVSFDAETYPFGPARMAPRIVCYGIDTGEKRTVIHRNDLQPIEHWLREACEGRAILVNHSISYDMALLLEHDDKRFGALVWGAYDKGAVHCTFVREKLVSIAKGTRLPEYTLSFVAKRRKGIDLDKLTWRTGYAALDHTPIDAWPKGARDYAMDDATAAREVYLDQKDQCERMGYKGFEDEAARQARADFALRLMSAWGVRTDSRWIEHVSRFITDWQHKFLGTLQGVGIIRPDESQDMKRTRELVEASWPAWLGPIPKTKSKTKPVTQTGGAVIEDCDNAVLAALVHYKGLEKNLSFMRILSGGVRYPIHPFFNILVDSGRTSCSAPNMQQIPRLAGIREGCVARDGYVYISCDYDAQEIRTLAQSQFDLVGESVLGSRFQADRNFDPHSDFGAARLCVTYAEFMKGKKTNPRFKQARQDAKVANFGLPGGLGAKSLVRFAKLSYGVILSLAEAQQLKDSWMGQWPEMDPYFKIVDRLSNDGTGTFVLPRSGRWRGLVGYCDGANYFFQGPAADITKEALYVVARACYLEKDSPLYASRPCLMIHDELILESPVGKASAAAKELERLMVMVMEKWTPDVPAAASASLMTRWFKDAPELHDKDGNLIPAHPPLLTDRETKAPLENYEGVKLDETEFMWTLEDLSKNHKPSVGASERRKLNT